MRWLLKEGKGLGQRCCGGKGHRESHIEIGHLRHLAGHGHTELLELVRVRHYVGYRECVGLHRRHLTWDLDVGEHRIEHRHACHLYLHLLELLSGHSLRSGELRQMRWY